MKTYMPYVIMMIGVLFALAPLFGEKHKDKIDGLIRHLKSNRKVKDS